MCDFFNCQTCPKFQLLLRLDPWDPLGYLGIPCRWSCTRCRKLPKPARIARKRWAPMLAGHGNPGGIAQPATTSIEASSNEKSYSLAAVRCDSRIFGFGTRLAYVMTGWLPRIFTHPICDRFQSLRLERPVASGDMSCADNLQKVVCYLDGSHRFPTDSPQL